MPPPYLQTHKDGTVVLVRVTPKSSRSTITGVHGDELKVSLKSPPVDGAANKELIQLLSKVFKISKSQITILRGKNSRSKQVLVHQKSLEKIEAVLASVID